MVRTVGGPSEYSEISYTVFYFKETSLILRVLLEHDARVREHVLFDSDFYMAEMKRFEEKRLSIYLRAKLGEMMFKQISEINPMRFLGISN